MTAAVEPGVSGRARFARAIIDSFAAEGAPHGDLSAGSVPSGPELFGGVFYIDDVPVDVLRKAGTVRDLVRATAGPGDKKARVLRSRLFTWMEPDIRARFCHHLMVQPFNTLLTVEGILSYEDALAPTTPVWGEVACYRSLQGLWSGFTARNKATMNIVLGRALGQMRGAVRNMEPRSAVLAARKIEVFAQRILAQSNGDH